MKEIGGGYRRNAYALLAISAAGMILFRNEAVYILEASFLLIACIYKKVRKIMGCYLAGTLLFYALVFRFMFPMLSITPGSVREMLAVPFQQTARYVREFGHEVTAEEREAIAAILNYEKLAEKYDPNNVDNVKATYNEYATREELLNYFEKWFQMFLKHPTVYVQATMNNYYRYFYPGPTQLSANFSSWSEECMEYTNEKISLLGMEFYYPGQMKGLRENYDFLYSKLDALPIYNILVNPAVYVWFIMLCFFYGIRKKNLKALALLMVPVFMVLIRLAGPCNGQYCRYMYPVMVLTPYLAAMIVRLTGDGEGQVPEAESL